jgi:tRNA uridine 5-carboxymethylaminomethyl modification enzyme
LTVSHRFVFQSIGPRAQADRDLYKKEMQALLLNYPNLSIVEASAEDLIMNAEWNKVEGVKTNDGRVDVIISDSVFNAGC